jgi:DNA-binding beta-propeller fold protein YncE
VGAQPRGIAIGGGYVWVANSQDDTISRIDPTSMRSDPHRVGDTPFGISVGGGAVWVANQLGDSLTRVDSRSFRTVGGPLSVPSGPKAIDADAREVWVTSPPQELVTRIDFETAR